MYSELPCLGFVGGKLRDSFKARAMKNKIKKWGGGGGYLLMRRTFVIYKDATSSLPNLHQGVQES